MDKLNNDFYNALDYERSMFGKTDIFYEKWIKNILYASYPWNLMEINLSRWDWNTPEGRTKQMSDIDITIDVDVKSGQIKNHYNISEKFRTDDYGDMFIELYSKYPNVNGWGPTTEADLIFYHTPKNLYYIDAKDIKRVSNDIMNTININHLNDEMVEWGTNRTEREYNGFHLDFIKVPTYVNDKKLWTGIGVCIQWDVLRKLNVKYEKIDKNFVNSL